MISIESFLQGLVFTYGPAGVFLGMLLESSIIPLPSEFVLITAGVIGIDLLSIVVYGTIGSTLGSIIGYYIGKLGGRPIIDRYGKYFFITPDKIQHAESWSKTYGSISIFFSRLIPFIPFKVFSIAAGILEFNLGIFTIYTFVGLIPRTIILGTIGAQLKQYENQAYMLMLAILLLGLAYYFLHSKFTRGPRPR